MLNEPDWPQIFWKTMEAAPTHHHAAYMAFNLFHRPSSPERIKQAIQIYERSTARLLESSAADRPGYVRLPAITGAVAKRDDNGQVMHLTSGQGIMLPPIPLRGAPRLRVGVYVEVIEGAVQLAGTIDGGGALAHCEPGVLSVQTVEHYWSVTCGDLEGAEAVRLSVTALNGAAVVRIRDYYPMFSIVRRPSR